MEKTKKRLEERLGKLNSQERKDNVVTFEQLGVDHIFVDESHYYKIATFYENAKRGRYCPDRCAKVFGSVDEVSILG